MYDFSSMLSLSSLFSLKKNVFHGQGQPSYGLWALCCDVLCAIVCTMNLSFQVVMSVRYRIIAKRLSDQSSVTLYRRRAHFYTLKCSTLKNEEHYELQGQFLHEIHSKA